MGNTTNRDDCRPSGDKYRELNEALTRLHDKSEELIRQADEITNKIRSLSGRREADRTRG